VQVVKESSGARLLRAGRGLSRLFLHDDFRPVPPIDDDESRRSSSGMPICRCDEDLGVSDVEMIDEHGLQTFDRLLRKRYSYRLSF
jgi:hypothetical protein